MCYDPSVTDPVRNESKIWDYCPGYEAPEAYDAFAHYRDTGPAKRTLAHTARTLGASYAQVCRWARTCGWDERCLSYDAHRALERDRMRAAAEKQIDEAWSVKRAALLAELNDVTSLGLAQLVHDLRQRRTRLRPNELRQLLESEIKWGNLANGDATDRVDLGYDLGNMSDEQLAALEAVRHLPKKDDGE